MSTNITPLRPPVAPALSSHSIPRTSSNKSLSSLNAITGGGHSSRLSGSQMLKGAELTHRPGGSYVASSSTGEPFSAPTPPFTVAPLTPSGRNSPQSASGRNSPHNKSSHALQQSTSNSSLRSASLRPSVSIPSMKSGAETTPSGSRQWSRTHCSSPSAPASPTPWGMSPSSPSASGSSRPPTVLVRTKPGSPSPQMHEQRSTSETRGSSGLRSPSALGGIAQSPTPRLQRKKSGASLLVSGIGRGLGRVGSVMRRGGNNSPSASLSSGEVSTSGVGGSNGSGSNGSSSGAQTYNTKTWSRRTRRVGSSSLQDLCEDENEARSSNKDMFGAPLAPVVVIEANGAASTSGRKSRDEINIARPVAAAAPAASRPPTRPGGAKDAGVSLPFNVQHDLHVTADLDGLPDHWIEQLKAQGLSEADLLLITAAQRRQRSVARIPIQRQVPPPTATPTSKPAFKPDPKLPSTPDPKLASKPDPKPAPQAVERTSPQRAGLDTQHHSKHTKLRAMQRRLSRFTPSALTIPAAPVASEATPTTPATPSEPHTPAFKSPPSSVATRPSAQRSVSTESATTVSSTGGATGIYRKPSIITKLLDDLDSVSAHPSRPVAISPSLHPPLVAIDLSDSEMDSMPSRPASPRFRLSSRTRSRKSSAVSANLNLNDDRRLSEELRDFRDLRLPGQDDGWASSVLAAWNDENSIAMNRTRTASPAPPAVVVSQRIPAPVDHNMQRPTVAAGFGLAVTPPSKPHSLRSIRPTAPPSPTPSLSPAPRRRSRSFDFDPAMRATLYSPPPPPPHPRKNSPAFHSVHGSVSLSAVPIVEKRRKSVDSFGNSPDSESCGSRSPSDSEIDLGTPPLNAEAPSTIQQKRPVHPAPKACNAIPPPLHIVPSPRDDISAEVPESETQSTAEDVIIDGTPGSLVSAELPTFPHLSSIQSSMHDRHRSDNFSFPSSVVSHSQTSHSSNADTRPQSPDSEGDAFSFTQSLPVVSTLGLCLSLGGEPSPSEPSPSPQSPDGPHPYSQVNTHARPHSSHPYANYPLSPKEEGGSHGRSLSTVSFTGMSPLARSNTKTSDDLRLSDNRASTLSRMSSIASSVHSYNIHEATVHRAYTRVLRRVNEAQREGTETPPAEDVASSVSACDTDGAMGALEEAAWRVAFGQGSRVVTN